MKKIFVLLLIGAIISLVATGCKDNDNNDLESNVVLRQSSVETTPNTTLFIPIDEGSGTYHVTISNPKIAEVSIAVRESEYCLLIGTKEIGEAVITVTDGKSEISVECSLIVRDAEFRFVIWDVKHAVDAERKDVIEADLRDNRPFPTGSRIVCSIDTEERSVKINDSDNKEILSGVLHTEELNTIPEVYSMIPPDKQVVSFQRWNMVFEDRELAYDMFLIKGDLSTYANMFISFYHAYFYEDLTEYYKSKYPDAGVKGVVRVQVCEYELRI